MKIVTSMLLIIGLTASAWANQANTGQVRLEAWADELNLTTEQIKKIRQIRKKNHAHKAEKTDARIAARHELRQLLKSDSSQEDIQEQYDELTQRRNECSKAYFDHILEIREVLTPDQKKKMKYLMKTHRKFPKHKKRMKRL